MSWSYNSYLSYQESIYKLKQVNFTELLFRTKLDVSVLRMYGCTAFLQVPKEKRKALDDQSEECILIGYGSGNIYRLLSKKTRKLIIARDVKFEET
jgi:hypothetical protein